MVSKVQRSLPSFGVVGVHKSADAVFAAIGADQDFALYDRRRHRLAVAVLGIGDFGSQTTLPVLASSATSFESSVAT